MKSVNIMLQFSSSIYFDGKHFVALIDNKEWPSKYRQYISYFVSVSVIALLFSNHYRYYFLKVSLTILLVSSTSGVVCNPSVGAITDHNQSAKDIDPFLSPNDVKDPATESIHSFNRMIWANTESKRMAGINVCHEWD